MEVLHFWANGSLPTEICQAPGPARLQHTTSQAYLAALNAYAAELELVIVLDEAFHGFKRGKGWGRTACHGALFLNQRVCVPTQ
eukprot:1148435-Pelagomonas_calceolata.AAC.2